MLFKKSWEYSSVDFINFKGELRTLPKAVTLVKACLRSIIDPIGLQPFNHVVVTGQEDDLPASASPRLGESRRPDLGDLTVYYGGKLIDNGVLRALTGEAGEPSSELLAVAENVEGAQPRRNIAEADRRQHSGHGVEIPVGRNAVHNGRVITPPRI